MLAVSTRVVRMDRRGDYGYDRPTRCGCSPDWVAEAWRVLRSGGRLVIADIRSTARDEAVLFAGTSLVTARTR